MTDPMTPDLDAIRERWDRVCLTHGSMWSVEPGTGPMEGYDLTARFGRIAAGVYPVETADAVAGAPTDVAVLLAEVERLRAEAEQSRQGIDHYFGALEVATREVTRLRPMEAALAAVMELHQPYGIYNVCDHDHTEEDVEAGRAVSVEGEYLSCEEALLYWACSTCCTERYDDGEILGQSETCANHSHGHNHSSLPSEPICPTRAALDGGASGE